tara:strand:- start:159 stop:551 length:393 start_codon:yes stop_codon:yes gene_type:complete
MEIQEIVRSWENCGLKSIESFTLKPHYSILFDCEDEGFDHIWKHAGIDKQSLIETDDVVVHELIVDIDNLFHHSSELMQEFIVDYVLGEQEFETVVVELSELNTQVKDTYQDILNLIYKIKARFDVEESS